jgi:uncharacterized coiled-coil protein SlyX
MSNKNTIARTAEAISVMEAALEAARLEHASLSTAAIEAKMAAFSEVVRNTRRKMARPAGFDWALHSSFSVVAITDTHLKVETVKGRSGERVVLNVPRSDLSLSTWQVTGIIRRQSAERLLAELNASVTDKKKVVAKHRKDVAAAEEALRESEQGLTEASAAVERRLARTRAVEAKRAAARARRKVPAPELVAAQ